VNRLHLVALFISICSIVSCLLVVSLSGPRFIVLVPDLFFIASNPDSLDISGPEPDIFGVCRTYLP
jgi:hypothetical protein